MQVPEGRVLPCEAERVVQLPQGPGPGNEPFEGHRRLGQEMILERYVDLSESYGLSCSKRLAGENDYPMEEKTGM